MMDPRPPVLLFDPSYYGTLAAVRSLGRAGVDVALADAERSAAALWSRHARRILRCPRVTDTERFIEWLLRFGERGATHALYATSDELLFVLSAYREELSRRFRLLQPDLETTWRMLDKKRLLEEARAAGFDTPDTWFPENDEDVRRAASEADGPLIIKPRTQVMLAHHRKGALVQDVGQVVREYAAFERDNAYAPFLARRHPELTRPMIQRYYPAATQRVYSLTGFREGTSNGRSGVPVLGAVKVLQRPRGLGIGLCFESALVDSALASRAAALLERLGYAGAFEIEFLRDEDRALLIDMNPRLYNQVALDVARGLDQPRLAYAAAVGDREELERLLGDAARALPDGADGTHVFCNSVGLRLFLGATRLLGTMPVGEIERWKQWMSDRGRVTVDAVADADDPAPFFAEATGQVYDCLRHPRAFFRAVAP